MRKTDRSEAIYLDHFVTSDEKAEADFSRDVVQHVNDRQYNKSEAGQECVI